ncbi:MAG: hypothetical protein VCB26_08250 [Candidatus Hydrogenedentota bacterium]
MPPVLPQNDSDLGLRNEKLIRRRKDYQYDHKLLPPLPVLEKVPHEEKFSIKYQAGRGMKTVDVFVNLGYDKIRGIE